MRVSRESTIYQVQSCKGVVFTHQRLHKFTLYDNTPADLPLTSLSLKNAERNIEYHENARPTSSHPCLHALLTPTPFVILVSCFSADPAGLTLPVEYNSISG